MTDTSLIQLEGIQKIFFTDEIETWALDEIHLKISEGEYVSIAGPSGCGKSTLLSVMGLLNSSTDGQYFLDGEDVASLNSSEQARVRNRQIGFIFQAFNLIGDMTVFENVELPLTYRKELKRKERKEKVQEALEKVDMAHRMKHFPSQLSGGQQQRVAIARALTGDPKVLLADEPTGNLDSKNAQIVMDLLGDLHKQGSTICMVTHDPRSALQAQRQITLFDGKIVDDQPTSNLRLETEVLTSLPS
ncbi:MAG: ABC transporter ATP-binding protein [Pseudomonadales bacterium]|nr:ABC transporter ATP-binding protein [Pseudomonadales bacterium]